MKNINKILLLVAVLVSGASCNKFFDDMKPTDKVSDKVIWQTTKNAEYYVNYLYDYVYVVVANQTYGSVMTEAYTDMARIRSRMPVPARARRSRLPVRRRSNQRN